MNTNSSSKIILFMSISNILKRGNSCIDVSNLEINMLNDVTFCSLKRESIELFTPFVYIVWPHVSQFSRKKSCYKLCRKRIGENSWRVYPTVGGSVAHTRPACVILKLGRTSWKCPMKKDFWGELIYSLTVVFVIRW